MNAESQYICVITWQMDRDPLAPGIRQIMTHNTHVLIPTTPVLACSSNRVRDAMPGTLCDAMPGTLCNAVRLTL